MSSALIVVTFNRTDMTDTRRIDQAHTNGNAPAQNGQAPSGGPHKPNGQRKIDCCNAHGDEMDPAARVGDGYKRGAR